MKRILSAEYHKVVPYRTFWIVLGFYALLVPAIVMGVGQFIQNMGLSVTQKQIFSFPDVWHWVSFLAGFFTRLLALLVIIIAANEFKYGTFKQNIIDGYSRTNFWSGKTLLVLFVSFFGVIICAVTALIIGLSYSSGQALGKVGEMSGFLIAFFVQALGHCSIALFIAVLLRSGALAIVIYLLYSLIIENILTVFFPIMGIPEAKVYFPVAALSATIEGPWEKFMVSYENQGEEMKRSAEMVIGEVNVFNKAFFISLGYIVLFWIGSFFVLQKRDPGK